MSELSTAPTPMRDQIGTALAAFQAEMPTIAKGRTAKVPMKAGGSYSYTYAGLADIAHIAMPLLAKHGLSFVTLPEQGRLVGLLLHSSGQSLSASLPINGNTPQDIGSSLTYMRRYLLGCMTGLVTDDDDDGQLAQAAAKAPRKAAAPPPGSGPMTAKTRAMMFALFAEVGVPEDQQLAGINAVTGREYDSRGALTQADAQAVIAVLEKRKAEAKAGADA